jgi:hypothetical protein
MPMKIQRIALTLLCSFGVLALQAGELSPEQTAKILKVIASGCGEFQVNCKDAPLKAALSSLGISVEEGSPIVWCSTLPDAKANLAKGRLVVVGHQDLLSAACIVVEEEGGRPKILINTANLRTCKLKLGDAIMKIGTKL